MGFYSNRSTAKSETEVPDAQLVYLVNKVVQLIEAFKQGIEAVELHRDVHGATTECTEYFPEDVSRRNGKSILVEWT